MRLYLAFKKNSFKSVDGTMLQLYNSIVISSFGMAFLQFCMAFLWGHPIINDFLYCILNGGLNDRFKHMPYKNSTTILI